MIARNESGALQLMFIVGGSEMVSCSALVQLNFLKSILPVSGNVCPGCVAV